MRGFIRKQAELKKGSSSSSSLGGQAASGLSTDDVSGMYSGLFFVVVLRLAAEPRGGSGAQKESVTGDVQEKMRVVRE